jgi:hypothetical protein
MDTDAGRDQELAELLLGSCAASVSGDEFLCGADRVGCGFGAAGLDRDDKFTCRFASGPR